MINNGNDFEIKINFSQIGDDNLNIRISTDDNCELTQGELENTILLAIHQIRTDRYEARVKEEEKEKEGKTSWFKNLLKWK